MSPRAAREEGSGGASTCTHEQTGHGGECGVLRLRTTAWSALTDLRWRDRVDAVTTLSGSRAAVPPVRAPGTAGAPPAAHPGRPRRHAPRARNRPRWAG